MYHKKYNFLLMSVDLRLQVTPIGHTRAMYYWSLYPLFWFIDIHLMVSYIHRCIPLIKSFHLMCHMAIFAIDSQLCQNTLKL